MIVQEFRARKNLRLTLTFRQMSIVLGSVMGDAYIYPLGKICFEHGNAQRGYLEWKYSELKQVAYPKVSRVSRTDKRSGNITTSWRFFLRQYFRPLREEFYESLGLEGISPTVVFANLLKEKLEK